MCNHVMMVCFRRWRTRRRKELSSSWQPGYRPLEAHKPNYGVPDRCRRYGAKTVSIISFIS